MITLITGVPGSGKTAFTLDQMLKLSGTDRPLFVHGIPDLKIPHHAIRCDSPSCDVCPALSGDLDRANAWHEWAPDGSVIFMDETQNVFRPRSPSAKVPDFVAQLEVHRHRGLDFYLVTQHPNLIDTNVRRLVSRHVHLAGNWYRRYALEWGECQTDTQSETRAVKSTYKLPKRVFKLYKSATLHTKLPRKIPFAFYALFALILIASVLGYRVYQSRIAKHEPQTQSSTTLTGTGLTNALVIPFKDFIPTELNRPESAPVYAPLVKVKDFPRVAACIVSKSKCSCYTQQGTKLFITRNECVDFAKTPRFNPYHDPNKPVTPTQTQPSNHSITTTKNDYRDFSVSPEHEPMYIDEGIQ